MSDAPKSRDNSPGPSRITPKDFTRLSRDGSPAASERKKKRDVEGDDGAASNDESGGRPSKRPHTRSQTVAAAKGKAADVAKVASDSGLSYVTLPAEQTSKDRNRKSEEERDYEDDRRRSQTSIIASIKGKGKAAQVTEVASDDDPTYVTSPIPIEQERKSDTERDDEDDRRRGRPSTKVRTEAAARGKRKRKRKISHVAEVASDNDGDDRSPQSPRAKRTKKRIRIY